MSPATESSSPDETSHIPLARIDAQEESFVRPLREYLEANGCRVVSARSTDRAVTYHIVAGDVDFVKHFFSASNQRAIRRLGIVIGSSLSRAQTLVSASRKIVVVDPVGLTTQDVVEIFSFFFAGMEEVFDKRRNRHAPIEERVEDRETEDRHEEADEQRIGSIITDVFGQEAAGMSDVKKTRSWKGKKQRRRLWARVVLTIAVCCAPVVWYVASLTGTAISFITAGRQLQSGNMSSAKRSERVGEYWLQQGRVSFGMLRVPLQIAGFTTAVRGQERLLSFMGDTQSAFAASENVIVTGKKVALMVSSDKSKSGKESPAVMLDQMRLSVNSLNGSLGLAQAQLTTLLADKTFPFAIGPIAAFGRKALAELFATRDMLSYAESLLLLYPRIAGFIEPKTYLVLLQNSAELRPTGGFIGSIGKLTFDGGMLSDFVIQDVYAVDGQLKGHVDPPVPIRELLSQEHWYLRDSNWDPDFFASGQQAAWFYEKETGETVDGVIALSLPLVVDILRVTGPVVLSDYNDQITADNFFGKSIYYTKDKFFPGSTQKSDFLGTLARTLLLRLTTDTHINPTHLFRAFVAGLSRRDIQFMFVDGQLQRLVEHFGWAGRIFARAGCPETGVETCIFDPLVINEANLSVSKVNAFVKHKNHREIVVAPDGTITETSTLTLINTAQDNEPGVGGPYRTYIRFFVPADASVSDITVDGVPIASRDTKTSAIPGIPYIERVDGPATVQGIGVALEVAPGTNRRLRISYTRGIKLPVIGKEAVLDVLHAKQAGISDGEQSLTIRFPVFWKATAERSNAEPLVAKDGELQYNSTLLTDLLLRIRFTK